MVHALASGPLHSCYLLHLSISLGDDGTQLNSDVHIPLQQPSLSASFCIWSLTAPNSIPTSNFYLVPWSLVLHTDGSRRESHSEDSPSTSRVVVVRRSSLRLTQKATPWKCVESSNYAADTEISLRCVVQRVLEVWDSLNASWYEACQAAFTSHDAPPPLLGRTPESIR